MDRLTHKRCNGIKTGYWTAAKKDELVERLAAYEDTGLTPEKVEELRDKPQIVWGRFAPGDKVWVVTRDGCGEPDEAVGFMFLAEIHGAAIVSPYINDLDTVEETIDYHIDTTLEDFDTTLSVFPIDDCYPTNEAAKSALGGKQDG